MNNQEKKILILSAFVNPFIDNNNRVLSIANQFVKNNWSVDIITSDFSHTYKMFYRDFVTTEPLFPVTFIHVIQYKKNLSLKRIISHLLFALKAYFYLKIRIQQYHLIYSTTPTNVAPYLISFLAKKSNIRHVVDIIDIWPESFYVLKNRNKWLYKILTFPWKGLSHSLYRRASILISSSKKYANFGQNFRSDDVRSYLLGVDLDKTKELISLSKLKLPIKADDEIWIAYGGSLGHSYDFDTIIESVTFFSNQKIKYMLIFIGGGVLENEIKEKIDEKGLNAIITGRIDYRDYLKWLSECEIAINSYKKDSFVGYSYKFSDYLAAGCCILNNLPGETADIVKKYNIGENFDYEENALKNLLYKLINNKQRINYYRSNTNHLASNELSKFKIMSALYYYITKDIHKVVIT